MDRALTATDPRNAPGELWAPLNDPTFWAGDPAPHFARLRREAPIVWNPVFGYWALARHADVMTVSRDPATYCSAKGILAMEIGVTRFDTSVGGLGGSPFAADAAGNLATEDLVHLCDDLGIATGIDLDRLLEVSAHVAALVGHPVPSRVAAAGPRSRLA